MNCTQNMPSLIEQLAIRLRLQAVKSLVIRRRPESSQLNNSRVAGQNLILCRYAGRFLSGFRPTPE